MRLPLFPLRRSLLAALCIWLAVPFVLLAPPAPAWWAARGAINPNLAADDYAAANLGQLKHMARKAADELNTNLPGGAGPTINNLITSWQQPPVAGVTRDDYAAVNLGQLKSVAKPFYDRLIQTGYITSYPWTPSITDDNSYAVANLGQLKHVFSFDLGRDANNNAIPDWWESAYVNDRFDNAKLMVGTAGRFTGINSYASNEAGESNLQGYAGGRSLWYRWQCTVSDRVTFETKGSQFDTLLAIYKGPALSALTLIVQDDDGGEGSTSRVAFNAESGVTYWIKLDGYGGSTGEFKLSWITDNSDTDFDNDGMPDGWEKRNGLDFTYNDAGLDLDYDGLINVIEYQQHTLPNQPDTDDDGLSDGWEILYGFSALVNNETDADPTNDPGADPDTDGLTNSAEDQIGTNPRDPDTDRDGFSDLVEDAAASNATGAGSTPANPGGTPGGPATPPPPVVPVQVNFGDHSGSHSEKYKVILEPLEGDTNTQKRTRTNKKYGQTQTETFKLPAGAKYKITLVHIGTDPDYEGPPKPDYDYTLEFTSGSTDTAIASIPEDPTGMLGVHDESEDFFASGKDATLYIAWLTSETVATTPTNRKRKKLGVGEEVNLTLKPASLPSPTWALSGTPGTSTLTPSSNTANLEADKRACTPTAQATALGTTVQIAFNVVQPSGERARKTSDRSFAAGRQGAGMELEITTLPDDVSFYNVEVLEIDKGTQNITGFFTPFPASALQHQPNPLWIPLDQQNQWNDSAGFEGWGSSTTWAYGTYEWAIEVRWRVVGKETGQGEIVGNRIQTHTLHDSTGRSTESKLGNSATRTP